MQQPGNTRARGLSALALFGSALALLVTTVGAAAEKPVYTVGVVPQYEALRLAETWPPILEKVGASAGVSLVMTGTPTIPDFERTFSAGKFDFAYMNPYHAVMARQAQGYRPLIRDGDRLLFGILVVRADSAINSIDDLQGARIAFPAPNALGASLLMRANLTRRFDLNFEPLYAQTHTSSYLNVLLNKAAAAGGVRSTLDQQPMAYQNNLRVIYETQRVPSHPIVAHPRVPAEIVARVRDAFVELGKTDAGRALLARVPMHRPVRTSVDDYKVLEQMNLEAFAVMAGSDAAAAGSSQP